MPYIGNHLPDIGGYTAYAAIDKYRAVSVTSGTTVSESGAGSSTHGQEVLGIATESVEAGRPVPLRGSGVFPAIVNGASTAIAAYDLLKTTTGGIFIKADTTNDIAHYQALEIATTDGVLILVQRIKRTLAL